MASNTVSKILLTCPPMIGLIDEFRPFFEEKGIELIIPCFTQVMTEEALEKCLPNIDGWIIGDDPATYRVLSAGKSGRLKAVVKWGVGVDNIDFEACKALGLPVTNTPNVFGREVADIALTYVLGLARATFYIDRMIRTQNSWPKPCGISTWGKKAGIIGYGDIGKQTAKRLLGLDMEVVIFDPAYSSRQLDNGVTIRDWAHNQLNDLDFLIFTAPLNAGTYHMFNMATLPHLKKDVRIVNVSRGPIIAEEALIAGLEKELIHSAALDVFEFEPLLPKSPLRRFEKCIFGSHNASNTKDAVRHASHKAIKYLFNFLQI